MEAGEAWQATDGYWRTVRSCLATIRRVYTRDRRPIGAQVKSGVHLAGWGLLAFVFVVVLLASAILLVGKGDYSPIRRAAGVVGIVVTSAVMFATARHWVKWFFGASALIALKAIGFLLLTRTDQERSQLLEMALLAVLAAALCVRYLRGKPNKIEAGALTGMGVALAFTVAANSDVPFFIGLAVLAIIQLTGWMKRTGAPGSRPFFGR